MALVGCNVNNCAYNTNGTCYANKISVNGKKQELVITLAVVLL